MLTLTIFRLLREIPNWISNTLAELLLKLLHSFHWRGCASKRLRQAKITRWVLDFILIDGNKEPKVKAEANPKNKLFFFFSFLVIYSTCSPGMKTTTVGQKRKWNLRTPSLTSSHNDTFPSVQMHATASPYSEGTQTTLTMPSSCNCKRFSEISHGYQELP